MDRPELPIIYSRFRPNHPAFFSYVLTLLPQPPDLRDKKELIDKFIDDLTPDSDVDADWKRYVNREKREQFDQIITEEHLKREKAVEFIENAFQRGYVPEGGMELDSIMPPINPFDKSANRQGKIQTVLEKLKAFFNKFFDIADGEFKD